MGEFVRLEIEEGVGSIRLDRPPANVISRAVSEELRGAIGRAGERDDIGAVVVWGGPEVFAAGADIKAMAEYGPEEIRPEVAALADACDELERLPKVTIAAVNGYALGGGCEIALACDIRYAADDARLGQPEVKLGIIPGAGGTQRLPRLIGLSRAKDLVLSGRPVPAEEAVAIGLVDRVVAAGQVYEEAVGDARRYASGPRRALAAAKAALHAALGDPEDGLRLERDVFCELFGTQDQREGMRAFLEKRNPSFGGG